MAVGDLCLPKMLNGCFRRSILAAPSIDTVPPLSAWIVEVPALELMPKLSEPEFLTSNVALPPLDEPEKLSCAPLSVMFDERAVEVPVN